MKFAKEDAAGIVVAWTAEYESVDIRAFPTSDRLERESETTDIDGVA